MTKHQREAELLRLFRQLSERDQDETLEQMQLWVRLMKRLHRERLLSVPSEWGRKR